MATIQRTTRSARRGPRLSRRAFLAGTAGLTFALAYGARGFTLVSAARARATARPVGVWVRVAPDDTVTIVTPAAEMGQGSMTGVPVILAEELDADWSKVVLEMAPAEPEVYGYYTRGGGRSMGIYGSRAVMYYYDQMRLAGAQVRKVLVQAAAAKWGVDTAALATEPGVVVHAASGRRLTYGQIAAFTEMPAVLPAVSKADLKPRDRFRLIGKAVPRHDVPPKVDGSAQFSMDVRLPGMVYASTVHAPVQQARPRRWNEAAVKALPDVIAVVGLDLGVAVVADSLHRALAARDALNVEWETGVTAEGFDSEPALERTYAAIAGDPKEPGKPVAGKGDVEAAFAAAAKVYRATFRSDYGYHAQMEPLNAVARFTAPDRLEVWEGTQAPGTSRRLIAARLGLAPEQVVHHQMYMGGAFGRRTNADYTIEAALVAQAVGRPVKMIWTREEDLAFGMFRPQALQCVEAALDADGNVAGWRHCVVGDGGRMIYSGIRLDQYYRIPNQRVELRGTSHGIRLKAWRAVAHPFNVYAIEALVDEMAAGQGMDPLEFRRRHLGLNAKARRVFDAVEALSDWSAPRPAGRALGLSVSERSGTLAAGVVEVSLDRASGRIRVHKVWLAVDAGTVVQPEMARRNVESGVIYGLSSVLKERVTMRNGTVQQSNFNDYPILRLSEAPEEIHVEFVERSTRPTGIGEIGNPFIAAAVANGFYALTGKRLYHMPFTPARVREVLKA